MLDGADLVAFAASEDLERSERFYGHTLGLRLVDANPFQRVYDANGTQLRVTRVETRAPATYTVLGWHVADVNATIRELAAKGVAFNRYDGFEQDDDGVWTAPSGARIAWFEDPDGNVLSLQS